MTSTYYARLLVHELKWYYVVVLYHFNLLQSANRLSSKRQFVTRDHDPSVNNCANSKRSSVFYGGGWWTGTPSHNYYYNCGNANLNALTEPYWSNLNGIKSVVMKVKPSTK